MKTETKKNLEVVVKTKQIKKLVGLVVSDKMDKTVNVEITEKFIHPKYGKVFKKSRKLMAHDENNEYKKGDKVEIVESRPFAKNKSWKVVKSIPAKLKLDGSTK